MEGKLNIKSNSAIIQVDDMHIKVYYQYEGNNKSMILEIEPVGKLEAEIMFVYPHEALGEIRVPFSENTKRSKILMKYNAGEVSEAEKATRLGGV